MRLNMARMEEERAAMVAEVEAQIERALQSMMISESEPEDRDMMVYSRPTSRRSSVTSASGAGGRGLRSFGSTLVEEREAEEEAAREEERREEKVRAFVEEKERAEKEAKEKASEGEKEEPKKLKRFSATQRDSRIDGMMAVDENITDKSDKISKKVMEIQQKVGLSSYSTFLFIDCSSA